MPLDWFAGALASMSAAKDISQSLITLRDGEMIRAKVFELNNSLMDLQQQLMTAQIEQLELVKKVTELDKALSAAQKANDVMANYRLHRFETGALAYAPIFLDEGVPEHYLCTNCFDKGEKVTLQNSGGIGWTGLKCPRCDKGINTGDRPYQRLPTPTPRR